MLEHYELPKANLLVYTRAADRAQYPGLLAYSAHFAVSRDGKHFEALNNNYGILFAKATLGDDNTIHAKGLKKPWLFRMPGGAFGIAAVRVNADGGADEESRGSILLWTTEDLVHFQEIGLVKLHPDAYVSDVACFYDAATHAYRVLWHDENGNGCRNILYGLRCGAGAPEPDAAAFSRAPDEGPEGAENGNALEIDARLCDRLCLNWEPLFNVAVRAPAYVCASSAADLSAVRATACYSDGSTALKRVRWETDAVDFGRPGTYALSGTVQNEAYPFPLAKGYGDPVILPWKGSYYYIATNDNRNDVGLYVRRAETPAELFAEGAEEHLILAEDESRGLLQTFWAPEFHLIGGELYILFAVSGKKWFPECHLMKLKANGCILDAADWEEPVRICRRDGSFLASDAITLDMTYFKAAGVSYYVWSYRENIGTPLDSGSMLFIATVDEAAPWKLASDPVLLSRPLFGWENVNRTINNEGPYPIVTDDAVFLTYSGGAADSYTYVLGMLSARVGDDLLRPSSWTKSGAPVLSFYSVENIYGPGHNSFFTGPDGDLMIAYHAEETLESRVRCPGIRRVHFNIDGRPVFDLSAERDLNPELSRVEISVRVPKAAAEHAALKEAGGTDALGE